MPVPPIGQSTMQRIMDKLIDKRVSVDTTLTDLLFPPALRETLITEYAQVDVRTGTTSMAPFVKKGQKSVMVSQDGGSSYTIETPYINISRPMQYTQDLFARGYGENVFIQNDVIRGKIAEKMMEDANKCNKMIDTRIEWMVAQMLTGTVSYTNPDGDSWTISTGKPGGNTFTASTLWSNATPNIYEDICQVQYVINQNNGMNPDIAICGANATAAINDLLNAKKLTAIQTTSGIAAGDAVLAAEIGKGRLRYLGRFGGGMGIPFYAYTGQYLADDTGAATDLIRTDHIEFLTTTGVTKDERKMFFGRIPTMYAALNGRDITQRLVDVVYPDQRNDNLETIIKSRPLPWFYRPEWYVSLKVV